MGKDYDHPVFYGTGGADGIPNPFCTCRLCEHARKTGGPNRRRRSMLRINEQLCIDFGPDTAAAAADHGALNGLRHVLITHTHEDHLYHALAETRALAFAPAAPPWPLELCLTGEAFGIVAEYQKSPGFLGGKLAKYEERGAVRFRQLAFGRQEAVGDASVLPLRGNHRGNMGEAAANYLLALPGGQTLYYGVDTGYYPEETFAALAGKQLDVLVSECTWGKVLRSPKPDNHLDMAAALEVFRRLLAEGAIGPHTRIYLTHINHSQGASHAELEQLVEAANFPCHITVAFDGCRLGG